ncbi:MAG: CHAT domain-containing protein, partial [Bacteroidota bacterium]
NRQEVESISSYFRGNSFSGEEATEENFKANSEGGDILHLAMHAIVDDSDPMMSRMLFYNDHDSLEDGLLHAFEIYNMRIPARVTVLSACETGFGAMAKGEGAMSLARAFAYAGSPSVVMSHWPVDDKSTSELMTNFYRYLSEGHTKGSALQKARQDFLSKADVSRSHPFFWAGFVVVGDDSPVTRSRWPWWILLIGVLITGGWLLRHRRSVRQ